MADHDPMCTEHDSNWEPDECPECRAIARVRADERVQVGRVWAKREDLLLADVIAGKETVNGARAALGYPPAHVEAVAARPVEVICEDDLWRELLEAKLDRISLMWRAACKERDAARAEVADLQGALSDSRHWAKETVLRLADAEAAAARLVEVICEQDEIIDSERMFAHAAGRATADLRAKIAADIEASTYAMGNRDGR